MVGFPATGFDNQIAGLSNLLLARQVTSSLDARLNHLLAALPDAERSRWLPLLELMDLPPGCVLHEADEKEELGCCPTHRPGLEARSCECDEVVKNEYQRPLPGRVATLNPQ